MRRPVAAAAFLAAVTSVTALTTNYASAAAPKKFTHTYYFHGSNMVGNLDQEGTGAGLMNMDSTKPSGSSKEFLVWGAAVSPNQDCGGNNLFPNWVGTATGNIVGTAKVTFWARSTPSASIVVRLYSDVISTVCNSSTAPGATPGGAIPIGEVTVAAPVSPTPVLMTVNVPIQPKSKAAQNLTVQLSAGSTGPLVGPQLTGISYDSPAMPASVTFSCTPKKGKKAC